MRVVVTQRWRMRHHVKKGERLFVVPGFLVQEPVPWGEIPAVIARVQEHVVKTMAPTNKCGDCKACCTTLYINEDGFKKPSHQTCQNCTSYGCGLYFNRPQSCRRFECIWLKSQSGNDPMAPELRPDRCGVIFTSDTSVPPDGELFEVHPDARRYPDRADVLGEPSVARFIDEQQGIGRRAKLITHYNGEE